MIVQNGPLCVTLEITVKEAVMCVTGTQVKSERKNWRLFMLIVIHKFSQYVGIE